MIRDPRWINRAHERAKDTRRWRWRRRPATKNEVIFRRIRRKKFRCGAKTESSFLWSRRKIAVSPLSPFYDLNACVRIPREMSTAGIHSPCICHAMSCERTMRKEDDDRRSFHPLKIVIFGASVCICWVYTLYGWRYKHTHTHCAKQGKTEKLLSLYGIATISIRPASFSCDHWSGSILGRDTQNIIFCLGRPASETN